MNDFSGDRTDCTMTLFGHGSDGCLQAPQLSVFRMLLQDWESMYEVDLQVGMGRQARCTVTN